MNGSLRSLSYPSSTNNSAHSSLDQHRAVIMLFTATHFGMPVSTTHDIVGCILGFTVSAKCFSSVHWDVVIKIFISWITSPLISGLFAAIIFGFVKYCVMRAPDPYLRAYYTFPLVLLVGVG
jgi:phosphate/sulfate permease